jgi:G3E family GTPase
VRDDGATNEAQKQVACADVILLNKTDLVSAQDLDEVAATVAGINPTLRVHKTVRGQVPLKEVFDLRAFTSPAVAALEPADSACCSASGPDHTHNHNRAHAAGPNAVSTATLPLPPLSTPQFERLNALLESLLWHRKWPADMPSQPAAVPDVLRTKGYAVLADGSARLIQGVSDLFEIRELADEGGVRPKVVFIGRGVEGLDERAAAYVGV